VLKRVITAIVLLMVIVALAILSTSGVWTVVSIFLTTVIAYEYGQLIGFRRTALGLYVVSVAIILSVALLHLNFFTAVWSKNAFGWEFGFVLLGYWAVFVPYILKNRLPVFSGLRGAILGWLMLFTFGAAVAALFAHKTTLGWASLKEIDFTIFYLIILVWVADSAAYFIGKTFGRHKLAVSLSPGKSIEGVIGGVIAVLVFSALYFFFFHEKFLLPGNGINFFLFILLSIPLSLLSVIGDLLESYLKRTAGVKDSGGLLPGHGGFYDRMDAQVAVLTLYPLYHAVLGLIGGT